MSIGPLTVSEDRILLDQNFRKGLIEDWAKGPNQVRKDEAFKAYECLKDRTINYVLDLLLRQFDEATVVEMQYAMSNISIFRKVIGTAGVSLSQISRPKPLSNWPTRSGWTRP